MIKTVLFDADGVILKPHKYFSQRLKEEGREVQEGAVLEFFKREYKEVAIGKANLREKVSKYLKNGDGKSPLMNCLSIGFQEKMKLK